jgi:hypothetical protein
MDPGKFYRNNMHDDNDGFIAKSPMSNVLTSILLSERQLHVQPILLMLLLRKMTNDETVFSH